jgi:hypothetical protein
MPDIYRPDGTFTFGDFLFSTDIASLLELDQ